MRYCNERVVTTLVGNKNDMTTSRQVTIDAAEEFAEAQELDYIETSAKNGVNVEDAFVRMAKNCMQQAEVARLHDTQARIDLPSQRIDIRLGRAIPGVNSCC